MHIQAYESVLEDEAILKAFLKEAVACLRYLGKNIDIPYFELVAFVETAKQNPHKYRETKGQLYASNHTL